MTKIKKGTSFLGVTKLYCNYLKTSKVEHSNHNLNTVVVCYNRSPTEIPYTLKYGLSIIHKGHYFNYVYPLFEKSL